MRPEDNYYSEQDGSNGWMPYCKLPDNIYFFNEIS
jgi:hypothetical protein